MNEFFNIHYTLLNELILYFVKLKFTYKGNESLNGGALPVLRKCSTECCKEGLAREDIRREIASSAWSDTSNESCVGICGSSETQDW